MWNWNWKREKKKKQTKRKERRKTHAHQFKTQKKSELVLYSMYQRSTKMNFDDATRIFFTTWSFFWTKQSAFVNYCLFCKNPFGKRSARKINIGFVLYLKCYGQAHCCWDANETHFFCILLTKFPLHLNDRAGRCIMNELRPLPVFIWVQFITMACTFFVGRCLLQILLRTKNSHCR